MDTLKKIRRPKYLTPDHALMALIFRYADILRGKIDPRKARGGVATPRYIIVHHTGGTLLDPKADTSHHTFEDVNAWHRTDPNVWLGKLSSLGYSIGYHYFIDKNGKVTQGRADTEQAAHCVGHNNNPWDKPETYSIGICLAGNFDVTLPTKEQIQALKTLLDAKKKQYSIPDSRIIPHRTFANKSCYGRLLSDDWVQKLMVELPPTEPCTAVVEEQKRQIKNLRDLVQSLISLFRK